MKKLLALFLALAMLLPFALPVNAEGTEVKEEPFVMINFADLAEGKFDNVFSAPFFWTSESVGLNISWGTRNISELAQKVKTLFDSRIEGARYIRFSPPHVYLKHYLQNHIYMDRGVKELKAWLVQFLAEYKKIGGQLDGFMLDVEIVEMGSYYLWRDAQKNPKLYSEIVNDPRYATEVRPLLVERGFRFWEPVGEYTPEIYCISHDSGEQYAAERAIWDRVMRNRLATYLNQAVCEPLWQYYPDANVSDYQSADRAGWHKFLSDTGDNSFGALTALGGSQNKVGNSSNHNVYHCRPGAAFYKTDGQVVYKNPYSYNEAIYEESAFNMTLWEINHFKNIYASTDNKKMSAWLTSFNYGEKPLAYSSYTTEIVYHLGLLNPTPFLGYVVENEVPDVGYYERLDVISQQLHELTRLVGYSDRQVIEVPANWNDSYLLSGMYANGRNIWRITPDTTQIGLQYFQIEGTDPTFRVNGKTITFPGGKIIADTAIDRVGSCGYWVETAKDVTPIITTDADRFEKYPSLLINFENCKEGDFKHTTAAPINTWEFKWDRKNGSNTAIVANETGKALAINGDVTLKSVTLPGNISAGDTYAKDQAWSVTVTIPEGLSADAEINLLGYAGNKQKTEDGGFKIAGGKVYYAQLGKANEEGNAELEYKELTSIAAGTYTLERVMNFNDAENFTAKYVIYDAEGKEIKSTKEVAVPVFTTITSINFITKQADKGILLDDYKITLTGKAADFELYDAKTGIPVMDLENARTASTAYRLSWLNATQTAQTATIVAAIYESGALKEERIVKNVQMNPGCDGVETGIVDIAEGQSVRVYLKTGDEPVKRSSNIGLIAIIAAAVVAVLAVVIALVATKPKKPTPPVQTEEESETPKDE